MKHSSALTAVVLCLLLASCEKDNKVEDKILPARESQLKEEVVNTFKGPNVNVGNGKVRSWIKVSGQEQPLELGIEFTPAAMSGLPAHVDETEAHPHWDIPLHQKAKELTAFDHIEINWNPEGHPPAGLFDLPHFDAHFYLITVAEQLSIVAGDPKAQILPPSSQWPAGYVPSADVIPAMGKHWIAPPLAPPFTKVLLWGSYNGRMTFIEPMVTVAYMQNGAPASQLFGQPAVFPKPGNYPMAYNVYRDPQGHHQITLSHFVAR